ncbi:MAG: hypothetical protein LBD68_05465 [Zoogloeaceae bacterium]|jgi:hypothetical protein|nr:hypothetical protein [Zoogloeaceae bacterium]
MPEISFKPTPLRGAGFFVAPGVCAAGALSADVAPAGSRRSSAQADNSKRMAAQRQ